MSENQKQCQFKIIIGQSNDGQQVSGSSTYGKSYAPGLETVVEDDSEEESEEDPRLLIDEIIRDKNAEKDAENNESPISNHGSEKCSLERQNNVVEEKSGVYPSSSQVTINNALITMDVPFASEKSSTLGPMDKAMVSPYESHPLENQVEDVQCQDNVEEHAGRFSKRNLDKAADNMMERATNFCKKRNLQGLQEGEVKDQMIQETGKLMRMVVDIAKRTRVNVEGTRMNVDGARAMIGD